MLKIKYRFSLRTTLLALFLMFFFTNNVFASVDKIVFINEPQTIVGGVSSEKYQIQLQNSSGGLEIAPDTTYFTLPLEIGDFSSQKDGAPFTASTSVYIATGSSNKYFYFKSSRIGEYNMVVSARNKTNTKQWGTEQVVKVVDSAPVITDPVATSTDATTTPDVTSTSTATTTIITNTITRTVYVSTHSDSEDLSNYVVEEPFKISSGRERIAYVGTPLVFNAKSNKTDKRPVFTWSFGDVTQDTGDEITHTYKHVGEYSVVLNGTYSGEKAVSRTNVRVLEPKITLSVKSNNLEIENNGEEEINIGGWEIKNIQYVFPIPKDTIIGSKKKIILSAGDIGFVSGLNGVLEIEDQSLNIIASTQFVFGNISDSNDNSYSTISKNNSILESALGMKVEEAEKIVADNKRKIVATVTKDKISVVNPVASGHLPVDNSISDNNSAKDDTSVATVSEAGVSTSSVGFWKGIIMMPSNGIKAIYRVFYDL